MLRAMTLQRSFLTCSTTPIMHVDSAVICGSAVGSQHLIPLLCADSAVTCGSAVSSEPLISLVYADSAVICIHSQFSSDHLRPIQFQTFAVDSVPIMGILHELSRKYLYVQEIAQWKSWSSIPDVAVLIAQVPLSFAAAVGSVPIMKMLRKHCEERCKKDASHIEEHVTKYLTHQDDFGNSAMHVAVLHNQKEAFDWLHENGGNQALEVRWIMLKGFLQNSSIPIHGVRGKIDSCQARTLAEETCLRMNLSTADSSSCLCQ